MAELVNKLGNSIRRLRAEADNKALLNNEAGYRLQGHAPIAQLDRVPGFEPGGREFESLWARQFNKHLCGFWASALQWRRLSEQWP